MLWLLSFITVVIITLVILLQTCWFQNFVVDKATAWLSLKLNTSVQLEEVNISFPKSIYLRNLLVPDQRSDTLLYIHELSIDISMMRLLRGEALLNAVELNGATVYVSRSLRDSSYNFDFIVNAFSSPSQEPVSTDTTKSSFNLSIGSVITDQLHFFLSDEVGGMKGEASIGHLAVDFEEFDLAKQKILVNELNWSNSKVHFRQEKPLPPATESSAPVLLQVGAHHLTLTNLDLLYADTTTQLHLSSKISFLEAYPDTIDLSRLIFDFQKLSVEQSSFYVATGAAESTDTIQRQDADTNSTDLAVRCDQLSVSGFDFRFDDKTVLPVSSGMDYSHLDVKGISGDFSNLFYQGSNIKVDIHAIKASEKCGLIVKEGYGRLRMTETGISFDSCLLITEKSTIRTGAGIRYQSPETISQNIGEMGVYGNMKNASIAISELLYFYPPLAENEYVKPAINRILTVDGKINGTLNNLLFKSLKVRTGNTDMLLSGSIKGLPDADKLVFDVQLSRLTSTRADILALLPDSLLPAAITLPETFTLSGNYSGTMQQFDGIVFLQSSIGNALVEANMQPVAGKETSAYHAKIDLENFDLGKLLQQEESIGIVNLTATAVGEGFTVQDMNTVINANVKSLDLLGYVYHDIAVNGKIAGQAFNGDVSIDDEAIAFTFDGEASLDPDNPEYKFLMDVKYADLQQLHLYGNDLKFAGKLTGDFTGDDLSTLNGSIYMYDAAISSGDKIVSLDSISLLATSVEGKYDWNLYTPVVDAHYTGTSSAAVGIPLLTNHFNYYFSSKAYRLADTLGLQSLDFEINIHDQQKLLPLFIPGLEEIEPFHINGSFNSTDKHLRITSTPVQMVFAGVKVDSLLLFAESTSSQLDYRLTVKRLKKDTLQLSGVSFSGFARNDSVHAYLSVKPDSDHFDLLIGASITAADDLYRLHLLKDQLIFDEYPWSVPDDNFLAFGKAGMWAHHLRIAHDSSYLFVQSAEEVSNAPVNFTFHDFDLSVFAGIIDSSAQVLTGVMNGNFLLKDYKAFTFNSALRITDFSLLHNDYGNLSLDASNDEAGKYDVRLVLLGAGNGIVAEGYFKSTVESDELHFDVKADSADFSLAAPFARPYLYDLQGSLNGSFNIRGTTDAPAINGSIRFDSASLVPSYTNTLLRLGHEPVTFDNAGIHFNALTVRDLQGNKATINGDLLTADYRNFKFGLNLKASDFVLMNAPSSVTTDYYGMLRLDFLVLLRGDLDRPVADVKIKLREGTDVTYIYQRSDTSFSTEEGMVEFINVGDRLDSILAQKRDSLKPVFSGYDITAAAEVDDKSRFNIVIDPTAGDRLQLKGKGSFNYDVNPSGKMTLTGRYEITDGSYNLTLYNVVKRQFLLDKGSSISWTGDLYNADIDLKGHLAVRTSPYALIGSQAATASDEQQAQYKNPLDFNVFLIMQQKLLAPDISFDIELDEKDKGAMDGIVDAKLAELREQEGEMNKQVFALMVLGAFVATDPLAGTGSNYISDLAKSSVSNILSSQLNKLSSQYVKGVDLNFDLKSVTDYSNGVEEEKTRLNVGVREQLFNDRLLIYVGTNFDIGGSSAFSAAPSDLSGDFSLEYLLRPDGRLRLNLFRKGSYEGIFEGQTIENGLSVIFNRDFNTYRQLFTSGKPGKADQQLKQQGKDETPKAKLEHDN